MKNNLFYIVMFLLVFAGYNVYRAQIFHEENSINTLFTLQDVESQAEGGESSLEEWWNRKDYVCEEIYCYGGWGQVYKRTIAVFVGEGQGTVAHTWNCVGCDTTPII